MDSARSNRVRGVSPPEPLKEARMGIFSYIKIGLAVAVFVILGYFVYEYKHMEAKIAAQKTQIDNLKLEQDIMAKKQKTFDDYLVKKGVIKKRVTHEEQQVDQTVDSGDVNRVLDMFHKLHNDKIELAPHGRTGRAKPAPR